MRWLLILTLSLTFGISCNKQIDSIDSNNIAEQVEDWYPTTIGSWSEFKIDTVSFLKSSNDSIVTIHSSSHFFREEILDSIVDFGIPYQLRILVQKRKDTSLSWIFHRYYTQSNSANALIKNEDNFKFVKLQFPLRNNVNWKGNKYIDSSSTNIYHDWNYKYTNLYYPFYIENLYFDSTFTVIQHTDSNAIEKTLFFEVYAKKIGLIYAEYQKLEKQNGANPWTMPENGYIIKKTITNWKK